MPLLLGDGRNVSFIALLCGVIIVLLLQCGRASLPGRRTAAEACVASPHDCAAIVVDRRGSPCSPTIYAVIAVHAVAEPDCTCHVKLAAAITRL